MDYAEELVACQQHMISLCGQMGSMDEPANWSVEVTKLSGSTR
jgi:hypothetical protein